MADLDHEPEWIRRSQKGDHQAFEALIHRYQRMIHSLTFRMTGSLSDAEDLAQETFIRSYQQLRGFRGEAGFSSWLYRIAMNQCLNWRKGRERREQLHEDWAGQQDQPAQNEGMAARVQEALMKLKPKQRAAVVLTTYEGMNHAQAARALGCSETTVSWRIFAARRKLKQLLQPGSARGPRASFGGPPNGDPSQP
ncbi:MAG: RNA polymerase sigma factor [Verrucomicrobia bacterium]|nr:RNA polymerase sigma factor [Verrucomicrobiota bacterium]